MKKILSVLLTAALLCSVSAGAFSFETESDETVPSTKDTSASMDAQEVADAIGKPDEESLSEVMEAIDDESSEQSAQTPVGRNVEEFDEATDQQEVAAEFVQEQNAGMESVEESDDSSDGDMVLPVTLDVTVPDSSHIIINPYCIPIDLNGVRYREQIVCQENLITSGTNIPLRVSAEAIGFPTENSEVLLVSEPDELSNEAKTLFIWFEFQLLSKQDARPEWSGTYTGAENQIVVNTGETNVLIIPAADVDAPAYAVFRAFGYTSVPDTIWRAQDNANFQISFKFIPELVKPVDDTQSFENTEVSDEIEPAEDAQASDETEPAESAEASNVEEPVDDVDDVSDLVKPTIGEPPIPMDVDEASDVEELVDVASDVEEAADNVGEASDETEPVEDETSDVEAPVDVVDEASDLVKPTIGEPPIPMDVDDASDIEEPADDVDQASDVEEVVDVADDASDVEEPADDIDEASDVEQPADDVGEASDEIEPVEDEEPSDVVEDAAESLQD